MLKHYDVTIQGDRTFPTLDNGDRYNIGYIPSPKLPTPLTSNEKRHLK